MILQLLLLVILLSEASNADGEPPGSAIFKDFAQTRAFIDKSLLIKYILDGRRHIYIEAPPGFGKTTNLQLVQDFFTMEIDSYGYAINAGKLLKKPTKSFRKF
nr:PREDICTED: uncharacterized protein LOC109043451 [Bemisia tabaci]